MDGDCVAVSGLQFPGGVLIVCITFGNPSDPCCDDAPAMPLFGFIQRYVYPEPIPDDVGLSDANWSTGITGNVEPNVNRSCLFHHFTTPNKKTISVFNILQPLRWSIETPAVDGGSFDHWVDLTVGGTSVDYQSGQLASSADVGIREKLLPREWHATFSGGVAKVVPFGLQPSSCNRDFDVLDVGGGESYLERSLQAISPTVPPWDVDGSSDTYPVSTQLFAFRHVVNGVPGKTFLSDEITNDDPFFVRLSPADTYQIDIWYRIGVQATINKDESPGKGCAYWPLRRVTNGSRQRSSYLLTFYNVDFSQNFNPEQQAFALSVAGHSGWTLRNGSNGPHSLVPEDGWNAETGGGGAAVESNDPNSFWELIRLEFSREIAQVIFVPGDAMKAKYPAIGKVFLYRPVDNSGIYRRSTVSADFGSVTHAGSGRFHQDGTTVFELVPWTLEGGLLGVSTEFYFQPATGKADSAGSLRSYREVPRRIIISRVSR